MGNTSDRVAGERHGAKASRAEGAGGHAPGKEHKIMVGSTDDPSVFSLPDSKVAHEIWILQFIFLNPN
uniref:Protein kinase AMP-activated non-catalytic subunit beta 2 n=1 Tax=Ursus maritimus TaxID=29073 RepID=A0A452TXJ5_URSMA